VKDLSLPVNNILLQVKGYILSYAEILHCIRNDDPEFVADPEEVIDAGSAGEYNCGKIKDIDLLLPEILYRYAFNLDE
jgi:hypothetical protein